MEDIVISFTEQPNLSLQPGDLVFHTTTTTDGNFNKNNLQPIKLGVVKSIAFGDVPNSNPVVQKWNVTVSAYQYAPRPTSSSYVFFVKNAKANYSGVSGYYAEVKLTNDKTTKSELFSVGSEISESSK